MKVWGWKFIGMESWWEAVGHYQFLSRNAHWSEAYFGSPPLNIIIGQNLVKDEALLNNLGLIKELKRMNLGRSSQSSRTFFKIYNSQINSTLSVLVFTFKTFTFILSLSIVIYIINIGAISQSVCHIRLWHFPMNLLQIEVLWLEHTLFKPKAARRA